MKKKLFSLFSIILIACTIGLISSIGLFSTGAKADEKTTTFEMLGASLRLDSYYSGKTGTTGLRFAAKVDKNITAKVMNNDTLDFGGVIVPADLLTEKTVEGEVVRPAYQEGENIFDYMLEYNGLSKEALSCKDGLTVGERTGYDLVAFSMINIRNKNLVRDFYGVIYIVETIQGVDGNTYQTYTFAEPCDYKSVHYVATATVADTEAGLTEEQTAEAIVLAKKAAYVASDYENVNNNMDITATEGFADKKLDEFYNVETTLSNDLEYAYANTYASTITSNVQIGGKTFDAYKEFSVPAEYQNYISVDQFTGEITLNPSAYASIDSELVAKVILHVLGTQKEINVTISNSVNDVATEVYNVISQVNDFNEDKLYYGPQILAIKDKFENLSQLAKEKVEELGNNEDLIKTFESVKEQWINKYSVFAESTNYRDATIHELDPNAQVTYTDVVDPVYGNVKEVLYTAGSDSQGRVILYFDHLDEIRSASLFKMTIYIKNESGADVTFLQRIGESWKEGVTLPADEWTEVVLANDAHRTIGVFGATPSANSKFLFSDIYTYSDKYYVDQANEAIKAIPKVIEGYHYTSIEYAEDAYAAVPARCLSAVTNYSAIQTAKDKYNEKYIPVLPVYKNSALVEHYSSFGYIANYRNGYTEGYGQVLIGDVHAGGAAVLRTISGSAPEIPAGSTIKYWVYKTTAGDYRGRQNDNWDTIIKVPASTWKLIEIPVEQFVYGLFGFWGSVVGDEIMYTNFWVEKPDKAVVHAIDQINKIPEKISDVSYGYIGRAREAVNAVPSSSQNLITNLRRLEEAEAEYAEYYIGIQLPSDYTELTNGNVTTGGVRVVIEEDSDYGEVLTSIVNAGKNPRRLDVKLSLTKEELNTYKEIVVYIYNGGSTVVKACQNPENGVFELPIGEWTKVVYDASKFSSQYIGVVGTINPGSVYKFSAAYVYSDYYYAKPDIENAIELIKKVPAIVDEFDYEAIQAAREAINSVPEDFRGLITNLETFVEKEAKYNACYSFVEKGINLADKTNNNLLAGATTSSTEIDPKYGEVRVVTVNTRDDSKKVSRIDIQYSCDLSNYSKVYIYIYNGGSTVVKAAQEASPISGATLPIDQWTLVEYDVSKFGKNKLMGVYGTIEYGSVYKFSDVFVFTDEGLANTSLGKTIDAAVAAIDALPETINGGSYGLIAAASEAVDALPESYRNPTYIPNLAELEAAKAHFNRYYSVISTVDKYVDVSVGWVGATVKKSVTTDKDYGKVYEVDYTPPKDKQGVVQPSGHLGFMIKPESLAGYDKVCIYIYNGTDTETHSMQLIGGSWTNTGVTLLAGEWTKVEYNVKDFTSDYILGVYDAVPGIYKFTCVFVETGMDKVEDAIEKIDNLPAAEDLFKKDVRMVSGMIAEVRTAINAVPEALRNQITGLAAFEALEAQFSLDFGAVSYVGTYAFASGMGGSPVDEQIVYDEVYGDVFQYSKTSDFGVAYKFTANVDINKYTKLYVAIKAIGGTGKETVGVRLNSVETNGGWNTSYASLEADKWTIIEIDPSDLKENTIGVWNCKADVIIQMSSIWAVNVPQQDVDQNDPF